MRFFPADRSAVFHGLIQSRRGHEGARIGGQDQALARTQLAIGTQQFPVQPGDRLGATRISQPGRGDARECLARLDRVDRAAAVRAGDRLRSSLLAR